MEAQFWIDSCHIGGAKTSFHRRDIHPYLFKHLPPHTLHGKRVLVPLCGKTLDLLYFRDHAAHVIGVELVETAVQQFFAEHNLPFAQRDNRYEAERLTLICGEDEEVTTADVGPLDLIYDRASLVALPLPMRLRCIQQVQALLPVGGQQFVNTLEYAPLLPEPPFGITPEEVAAYYGATHQIQHLEAPLLPDHGMARKFGLRCWAGHLPQVQSGRQLWVEHLRHCLLEILASGGNQRQNAASLL